MTKLCRYFTGDIYTRASVRTFFSLDFLVKNAIFLGIWGIWAHLSQLRGRTLHFFRSEHHTLCLTEKYFEKSRFFGENIFHRKSNFTIKIGFGHDPVRLLWAPWDIYTRIPGRIFKKLIIPVYGMALWYEIFGRKNRPKNRHFWGSRWQKVAFFHEKWSECDLNGL